MIYKVLTIYNNGKEKHHKTYGTTEEKTSKINKKKPYIYETLNDDQLIIIIRLLNI